MVYADESGFRDESHRHYGYAPKGEAVYGLISSQRTRTMTLLAARFQGTFTATRLIQGGCKSADFNDWLAAYETGGLQNLLKRGYALGRVPLLTEAQQPLLRKALEKPEGFHSYVQIQAYIAETFGVEINYKAVYARVHDKWGAKLKVPRPSHAKKTA